MMQVSDVSAKDRAVNATAVFLEAHEGNEPDGLYLPPRLLLAGTYLEFYSRDGVLVLAVETKDADPEVFNLVVAGDAATVPLAISLGEGRPLVSTTVAIETAGAGRHRKPGS